MSSSRTSLNAFDARLFADRYGRQVAGMVLIDPSDVGEDRFARIYGKKRFDAQLAADLSALRSCDGKARRGELKPGGDCVGPSDPHLPAALNRVQQNHSTGEGMWDAMLSERASLGTDLREVVTAQRRYGRLPLLVLTAGAAEDAAKQNGATAGQITAAKQLRKQLRDDDAALSDLGVHCIIPGVSHYMQSDKPGVVIEAVLQIVVAARTAAKPSCAALR